MNKEDISYFTLLTSIGVIGRVIERVNGADVNGMNRGVLEGIISRRIIERTKTDEGTAQ